MPTLFVRPRNYGRDANFVNTTRQLAQSVARIAATAVAALTDNSGGASANGTIEAIGALTPAAVGTNDALQAAGGAAGLGTIVDALKELAAKANGINAKVPALGSAGITDSLSGTAADGTIAAITVSYSGVGTAIAGAPGANAALSAVRDRIATLTVAVNQLCVACGIDPLVDASGGTPDATLTLPAFSTTLATATGADANANAIVLATDFAAKAQLVANAIKELAAKLNACRDNTSGYLVASVIAG